MTPADLLYSDTEQALRDSVRGLLSERCATQTVMTAYSATPQDFSSIWKSLATDLGLAALLVPEDRGGIGGTAREAAVVMEEVGRAAAPVPYLSSAVLATVALLRAGDADTLCGLAEGSQTGALVVPFTTPPHNVVANVSVDEHGLTGTVTTVAGATGADILVVPAAGSGGDMELHIVDSDADGLSVTPVLSLDMTRPLADVQFSSAPSTRVSVDAERAIADAVVCGAAMLASEQVGVAQWCFDTALSYVKERHQFGRAVGSFQAIKHRLADVWVEVGSAVSVARYAADCYARDDTDTLVATALAQSFCSEAALHAAEECIQMHGGIGVTWEHPAHLYLKRAKSAHLALGSPVNHRARLAELVDLPAPS